MYLGIDPSLSATGLCILDKDLKVIDYRVISYPAGDPHRLLNYYWMLHKYIKKHKLKRIGIEGYAYGAGKQGIGMVINIGEHGGALRVAMQAHDIEYLAPTPGQIKKFITGNGRAEKKDVMKRIKKDYGIKLKWDKKQLLDLYDAVGVSILTYFFYRRKRRKELDADQRDILRTIDLRIIKQRLKIFR